MAGRKYSNRKNVRALKREKSHSPSLPVRSTGGAAESKRINTNNRTTSKVEAIQARKPASQAKANLKHARSGTLSDVKPGTRLSRSVRAGMEADVARRKGK